MLHRLLALACAATVVLITSAPLFAADEPAGWGTIKGKFEWKPEKLPVLAKIAVPPADEKACLKDGPLYSEKYVVDEKTKGVRWVMVWLIPEPPAAGATATKLPIHPDLKKIPDSAKKLEVDQPCCQFIPHALCMREGQTVVFKNSSAIPHNVKIDGGSKNPNLNSLIPAGGSLEVDDWKASTSGVPFACNVHPWMNGTIRVFDHPYYAVTNTKGEFEIKNAPAGNYRIVAWNNVFLLDNEKGEKTKFGQKIEIKPGKVTELNIKVTPEE